MKQVKTKIRVIKGSDRPIPASVPKSRRQQLIDRKRTLMAEVSRINKELSANG